MSKLIDSSNVDYHLDREYLSSSGFKLLYSNPAEYYHKYVLNLGTSESKAVFDEGSYVHTLCLEPEKVSDYAIFPGLRKSGADWELFKEANIGKVILSMPQKTRCEALYNAYAKHKLACTLLSNGMPEHTMLNTFRELKVKARADYINVKEGYIVDIKTSGQPTSKEIFAQTIQSYAYDLSAALYTIIAQRVYEKSFNFYWLVLSKEDQKCAIYQMSHNTYAVGTHKLIQSVNNLRTCRETNIWIDHNAEECDNELSEEIEEI